MTKFAFCLLGFSMLLIGCNGSQQERKLPILVPIGTAGASENLLPDPSITPPTKFYGTVPTNGYAIVNYSIKDVNYRPASQSPVYFFQRYYGPGETILDEISVFYQSGRVDYEKTGGVVFGVKNF